MIQDEVRTVRIVWIGDAILGNVDRQTKPIVQLLEECHQAIRPQLALPLRPFLRSRAALEINPKIVKRSQAEGGIVTLIVVQTYPIKRVYHLRQILRPPQ